MMLFSNIHRTFICELYIAICTITNETKPCQFNVHLLSTNWTFHFQTAEIHRTTSVIKHWQISAPTGHFTFLRVFYEMCEKQHKVTLQKWRCRHFSNEPGLQIVENRTRAHCEEYVSHIAMQYYDFRT